MRLVMISRADARRRGMLRLPRQIPPNRIEEQYAKALVGLVRRIRPAWDAVVRAARAELAEAQRGDARYDVDLSKAIDEAVAATRRAITQGDVDKLARKFAGQTANHNKEQLKRQVKQALGVDPILKDQGLRAAADQFARENVALVRRIPERLHGDLEALVRSAVAGGRRAPEALARQVEERFGVHERHARLIARDQVTKYYAAVNHARQRELGVTRFVWRTVGDERVRDEHDELEGEVFEYDDPPVINGEPLLPGEDIQCRCYSEPLLDFGDDDEPDDEPDEDDDEPEEDEPDEEDDD